MEALRISLIDLSGTAELGSIPALRAIFETSKADVRLHCPAKAEALLESAFGGVAQTIFKSPPDVVFLILPKVITEIERTLIRTFSREPGRLPIIAVIEDAATNDLIDLFKLGIVDFITPPFRTVEVLPRIWRLTEQIRKKSTLTERVKTTVGIRQMIGTSPAFVAEVQKIPLIANCDSTVLISGETGTGKEMFARAIHYLGPRARKPFIPVNCGAIPAELIESELFGHAKGAFTSAVTSANGIIYEADGGTLFLDEIDCLTLNAQVKLLRFLQEKEYRQLGSAKTRHADVRIVAATNTDLEQAVRRGRFRMDLYYRLNIISLTLPPLRDRPEDIPLLTRHFINQYSLQFKKKTHQPGPDVLHKLLQYDWPGNVRELQNVLERAVAFSSGSSLMSRDIDINLPKTETTPAPECFQQAKARIVDEFEKKYIQDLLVAHDGNITKAARTAGKNRRAFWELMRKHRIRVEQLAPMDQEIGHSSAPA